MQEDKAYAIVKKIQQPDYVPVESDLKEVLQGIQRTSGQLIQQMATRQDKILQLLTSKLLENDKTFYSAIFSVIKQSLKWQAYKADILVISMIPVILSKNLLDNDEMIEVIMLTIYNEYFEVVNKPPESGFNFDSLGSMKSRYEVEFRDLKRSKKYLQITEINQNNIIEMHQMLLELTLKYLHFLNIYVHQQIIRLGFIYCGAAFTPQQLKSTEYQLPPEGSLLKYYLSDRSFETLLFMATSLGLTTNPKFTSPLIDLLMKKSANESRFSVAGLAQSCREVTGGIYDGLF